MTAAGGILLAWAVTRILDWGIDDKGTRDIGIVAVCILTIVGFYFALVFSPWVRGRRPSQPANAPAVSEAAAAVRAALTQQPPEPVATGETKIKEVSRFSGFDVSGEIDYYPPREVERGEIVGGYRDIPTFANLKLGEMALIRRLAVAPNGRQPSRRCAAVLNASGMAHPESSIATLEDLWLVEADGEDVLLTKRGLRFVYLSTQALAHDAGLVSAYRRITPDINRAVRFDGRNLSR